jgi:hypothetical protein
MSNTTVAGEQLIKSSYTILSNKPLNRDASGAYYEIDFLLPSWFTTWTGEGKKRIIKVYGCSFVYLESENKEPKISSKYANQFITVHSNIVRDDTSTVRVKYANETTAISHNNDNYMMTVNNFYTPKIYDVSNTDLSMIKISFYDATGTKIALRTSYTSDTGQGFLDEIYQAVFKIECELAILQTN